MKKYALFVIYGLMFLLFLFKMFYYREEINYVPDEEAHISYLAYLEENPGTMIPEFENMRLCEGGTAVGGGIYRYEIHDRTCYLGHPPLYYKIMHLAGGVIVDETDEGYEVYVNQDRLKAANIYLTGLVMILILYIGYTRLGRYTQSFIVHGIYAVTATSVPMLAFCGSGITNDNLSNLGVAVFLLGLMRYYERRKGYLTYFLVAAGFFLSAMSKLTVGEFLAVILFVVLIADIIQNRNLGLLCNRYFLATLPVYMMVGAYFLIIFVRYGSIQPGLAVVAPAEQSFVPEAERAEMNFWSYIPYFFSRFRYTWTGIYNGRFFDYKLIDAWKGQGFLWLFCAPFLYTAAAGIMTAAKRRQGVSKLKKGSRYSVLYMAAAAGLAVTVITQLIRGYGDFLSRGYMGGYQARYYLCDIPFMSLAMAESVHRILTWSREKALLWKKEDLPENKILQKIGGLNGWAIGRLAFCAIGILFIFWCLYGDFLYFLSAHRLY